MVHFLKYLENLLARIATDFGSLTKMSISRGCTEHPCSFDANEPITTHSNSVDSIFTIIVFKIVKKTSSFLNIFHSSISYCEYY